MARIPNLFDEYTPDDAASGEVQCKYCGAFPLEWTEARTRPGNRKIWRLVDDRGNFHACPAMAKPTASADDFEDLT